MMKMKFVCRLFMLISIPLLFNGCGEDDFPVPPASTVALFSYTIDNDGFAPATATFINESIIPEPVGIPSYSWSFGDGTTSAEENPVHSFSASGAYNVKLVVKTSISQEIKEVTKQIIIKNSNASGIPVFFTNGSNVFSGFLNDDPPIFGTLPIGPFLDSYDLDIDTVHSKLYISDYDAKIIYQCDLDGSNLIPFRTGIAGPDGLVVDYGGNRLYWDTDNGIQRADISNPDVNQKEDFVTGQANDPEGVSIDPISNTLYWTNYNGGLWSKKLDGTGEAEIIPLIEGGSTLVIGDRVYFDQYVGTGDIHLKSANLDGSGISSLTTGISRVVFGLGFDPKGNKIYWGDRTPGKIMRSNTDGTGIETWYQSAGSSPRGIVFGKEKPATNE